MLGAEREEGLVPSFLGLEGGDTGRNVVDGGVDDGVLREDGDPTRGAGVALDRVVRATVGSFALSTRQIQVRSQTGLVSSVVWIGGVGSDGLPGRLGMSGLLQCYDCGVVVDT